MGKKIFNLLKGQIASSIFYIALGLCLVLLPELSVQVICKIIFGIVLIGAGIYHIWIYTDEKDNATILDLFTGVIVLVLGIFLYFTPQIIIKLLPYLLGAFVLVDNIWMLKGAWKLKKLGNDHWKLLLIGSGVFLVMGIVTMVYSFARTKDTVLFAGCVMLADGLGDIVFWFLLRNGLKKGKISPQSVSKETKDAVNGSEPKETAEEESPGKEILAMQKEEFSYEENIQTEQVSEKPENLSEEVMEGVQEESGEEPGEEPWKNHQAEPQKELPEEPQEEVLEEWKD